ncbi:MAG TPA: hypothetical protein PLS01_06395, partial [Clostridia bacterium]|nr:hypothetical protein [Clostridia bacterium]
LILRMFRLMRLISTVKVSKRSCIRRSFRLVDKSTGRIVPQARAECKRNFARAAGILRQGRNIDVFKCFEVGKSS